MPQETIYNPAQRGTLLDILELAGRTSREELLKIREQRKGEQIGGTGHQTGTTLSSAAPGLVSRAIKQHSIGEYDIDAIQIGFESAANFEYDFSASSGKPVLVVDEIDGQKFTARFQSQRTTLEGRLSRQGWEAFDMRPDSAICMALFEGPTFEDIAVSVTTTMQGDVFSAIKESDGRSVAYINGLRVVPRDFQPPDLALQDCQIDIMGNTNHNLAGIGSLAGHLIYKKKYGEVRITSSGSSAIDIVNMIAGKMDAIVDLRALYDNSWASLEIADVASMYRFLKAVGFYVSDVKGNPLESYMTDSKFLRNSRITLVAARTEELGRAIISDLSPQIAPSIADWERRVGRMDLLENPDYEVITPKPRSPFKSSYIGKHRTSDQIRFVHVIELSPEGKAFLDQERIDFIDYVRRECRLALLAESKHPHIMEMETPHTLPDGRVSMVEPVCDKTLADVYKFGEKAEMNMFFGHMSQILDGLAFCHTYKSGPIVHGDLKLDNIGLINGVVKLDDFGVSSLVREVNIPAFRGRNIGAIDTRAPELFEEGSNKTPRSDIFSVGAVMYRMLTGYYPNPNTALAKPKKTDPTRPAYEQGIEQFRVTSDSYEGLITEGVRYVVEDLRLIILRLLDRNPINRQENAEVLKQEFDIIKRRAELYQSLTDRVKQEVSSTLPKEYLHPHLQDTESKLLDIDSGTSYAERVAAVFHDYERFSGKKVKKRNNETYSSYKRRHAECCARMLEARLREEEADERFIEEATTLVRYHDHLRLPTKHAKYHRKIERIRDADSLSFFDVNLGIYIAQHNQDPGRIKEKVGFMFNKMSDAAKKRVMEDEGLFEKIRPYLIGALA